MKRELERLTIFSEYWRISISWFGILIFIDLSLKRGGVAGRRLRPARKTPHRGHGSKSYGVNQPYNDSDPYPFFFRYPLFFKKLEKKRRNPYGVGTAGIAYKDCCVAKFKVKQKHPRPRQPSARHISHPSLHQSENGKKLVTADAE